MNNVMKIDVHQDVIAFDPEIELFRGEFIGLNGGADFYASDVAGLQRERAISLAVFLKICAEKGIELLKNFSGKFVLRADPFAVPSIYWRDTAQWCQAVESLLLTSPWQAKHPRSFHRCGTGCVTEGHSPTRYIERQYVCLATPLFLNESKAAARIFISHKCSWPNRRASIPRNCIATNQARPIFAWTRQRRSPRPSTSALPGLCMGRCPSPERHKSTRQCQPKTGSS